jgi:hypothetical protein
MAQVLAEERKKSLTEEEAKARASVYALVNRPSPPF